MYKFGLIQTIFILLIIFIIIWAYCNETIRQELYYLTQPKPKNVGIASFRNSKDSPGIVGSVKFIEQEDDTIVKVELDGVLEGKHGIHIHEYGDISNGCKSAGDHYNPFGADHGDVNRGHVGDLGNIISRGGKVRQVIKAKNIKLSGPYNIIGRTLVIHESEDDLGMGTNEESKRTGNSGKRIGCAVIGISSTS